MATDTLILLVAIALGIVSTLRKNHPNFHFGWAAFVLFLVTVAL
jgi:hypothetical protein